VTIGAGDRRCYVTLYGVTDTTDGEGGFTESPSALNPSSTWANVATATPGNMKRLMAGTVESSATHVVTMPYHSGVTTKTTIAFGTRTFRVVGVANPNERNIETICACVEIIN
jgi:head-tail adaptor